METFKTEVHVPPGSNIEFELHYQEMMHRKLGSYQHTLHLQPGRLVPHFQVRTSPNVRGGSFAALRIFSQSSLMPLSCPQVDVYIYEPNGISMVQVPNSLGHQFVELIKVTSTKDKVKLEVEFSWHHEGPLKLG